MAAFETRKPCLVLFLLIFQCSSFYLGTALSFDDTTQGTTTEQLPAAGGPPSAGHETMPIILSSPPFSTPAINKNPQFGPSINNQGLQSPMVYQQQQGLNYPQQSINQNQPLSGFTQPFSSENQPFLGVNNQPFSSSNQPFGVGNQQGLVDDSPFDSGASSEESLITGLAALVSLITLMVTLGFVV
ncbi:hypothetical protein ACOSP7_011140 [Xanthoceras sorbifolium]|uniref:Uncharacterized protein n=1 Tax=Xanthoceras sorbifolium TaxID=99658 RepID=A0ABQ8HRY9_9ROSI|nr:hypothetical protein JRO89_XS07G0021100 [Xanthoceras sorbifolium]